MAKHKVIFDTDPGVDDAMALLYLHHHPDVEIVGITTVFGNGDIDTVTHNALYLKSLWGIDAPVARGAGMPINPSRPAPVPASHVHGKNGLGEVEVPDVIGIPLDPRPAHRLIIDTVRAHPGEVTLVAVGRYSNLAMALQEEPALPSLVKGVIIMGGVHRAYGNVSPVASVNVYGDPDAADEVVSAAWPLTMVGLDVSMHTVMTKAQLADLSAAGGDRAMFLSDISKFYINFYEAYVPDGMMVHDSVACVYLTNPELFETQSGPIRVVCGGIADGQTIQRPDHLSFPPGPWDGLRSHKVCLKVDAPAVLKLIHDTIVAVPAH